MLDHRTHTTGHAPERPIPYLERFAKRADTERTPPTRPERLVPHSEALEEKQAAPDAPTGFSLRPVPSVRCLTLIEPDS